MTCIVHHSNTLRTRGYRMTPQRLAILQALHEGGHLSPLELYTRLAHTGLTETTVYRTLDFLAKNGILLVANRGNGHLAYELAGGEHHHLVCRQCGAQVEVPVEGMAPLLAQLQTQSGYRLEAGHLTLHGLCPACQEPHKGE